jgi:hypothetical protein
MPCPVPDEQQPINEYMALKESFFFRWAMLQGWAYIRIIVAIWLAGWVISAPIAAVSFSPQRHLWEFLCFGSIGATLVLSLPMLRLFLGWGYIKNRLQSPTVLYEESGWYDGQLWQKPETDLDKERLLVTYEVKPILDKLKRTLLGLMVFFALHLGAWQLFD